MRRKRIKKQTKQTTAARRAEGMVFAEEGILTSASTECGAVVVVVVLDPFLGILNITRTGVYGQDKNLEGFMGNGVSESCRFSKIIIQEGKYCNSAKQRFGVLMDERSLVKKFALSIDDQLIPSALLSVRYVKSRPAVLLYCQQRAVRTVL